MSPNPVHAARRAQLAQAIGPNGVAIVPTAPEQQRNRDADFAYRADSYFFYLTGFCEPSSWLVVRGNGESHLFCRPKDAEREIWDGLRLGPAGAPQALGVSHALEVNELSARMPHLLDGATSVWFPFATHKGLESQVSIWLDAVRARVRFGAQCPSGQHDVCAVLDEMRLVKDATELATMRRAGDISGQAHRRAMQTSAAMLRAGQDVREYHLEAELLYEFRKGGAQSPAYTSIVATGANACVLHYAAADAVVKSGDLVLIDAGCELDGYASDITRTFPANGRFSSAQAELYDIVLASQDAAIAATRAGNRFVDPHDAAVRVLAQGMLDCGLLNANTHGHVADVIEQRSYFQFYMHRTGHWLGLDVHDCGSYNEPGELGHIAPRKDPLSGQTIVDRPSRVLRPGMVLTLEPGIYVRPAPGVPERFHHIGIRIEDDAVVTDGACELLSRSVPVLRKDIEALMNV